MAANDWKGAFLSLPPQVFLKRLEQPFLYQVERDELYEIDEKALDFLSRCDGTHRGAELTSDGRFVSFCLDEGLLTLGTHPNPRPPIIGESPNPSLRYLELQLLHQCNLRCRHCYLGPPRPGRLPLKEAVAITREFAAQGGLRLVISGGEPLLYTELYAFLAQTRGLGIRRILLTNATLLTPENARALQVEEVQVSLDGWRTGHEALRGVGTFDQTLAGIQAAREAGLPISVATMVHRKNLDEFEPLARLVEEIGAIDWGVDVPCPTGSLKEHSDLLVTYEEAVPFLKLAFGGGYHGSSEGYACGRHLLTVLPTGQAVKCGFYADQPLGDARQGLIECWLKLQHVPLKELECRGCPDLEECAGGCRYRALNPFGRDPLMCALYGQTKEKSPEGYH
jgi:radical SAM protein with 4Fe4S-binding SPASM domain